MANGAQFSELKLASDFFAELQGKQLTSGQDRLSTVSADQVFFSCLKRLSNGTLVAWSADWEFSKTENIYQIDENDELFSPEPLWRESCLNRYSAVPQAFWEAYESATVASRSFDPVFNHFEFSILESKSFPWEPNTDLMKGKASSVSIGLQGVVPTHKGIQPVNISAEKTRSILGRKPANWWRDFAIDLAVYVGSVGIPDGEDTDGQSIVIEAVQTRMNVRGVPEASRASIQPVVNEVLKQIRAARKA